MTSEFRSEVITKVSKWPGRVELSSMGEPVYNLCLLPTLGTLEWENMIEFLSKPVFLKARGASSFEAGDTRAV